MVFLLTCKNEEDPIKNESARGLTRLCIIFSDTQEQSVVDSGRNSKSSKLLWFSFLHVPARNEEDPIKNEGAGMLTTVFPL